MFAVPPRKIPSGGRGVRDGNSSGRTVPAHRGLQLICEGHLTAAISIAIATRAELKVMRG